MSTLTGFEPYFKNNIWGGTAAGWDNFAKKLLDDSFIRDVIDDIRINGHTIPAAHKRRSTVTQKGRPATNVRETDTAYEVSIVAPGLKKSDFEVVLENNLLVISHERQADGAQALSQASFKYNWRTPEDIVGEDVSARYEAGILVVTVNKPASQEPMIEVIEVK